MTRDSDSLTSELELSTSL